jgi:Gluconate 2-dehydrogenase subunit 3/FAD binding domain
VRRGDGRWRRSATRSHPRSKVESGHAVLREFFARAASDLGVPALLEGLLAQAMMPAEMDAFGQLLDAIGQNEFTDQPLDVRTAILRAVAASSPQAKLGVRQLRSLTLLLFYALPNEMGRNPNWEALGYPGPVSAAPSPEQAPKTISVEQVNGATATLDADVCVVGSGAGGGVIAAELQTAGRSVLVLEMGQYRNESDFNSLSSRAYLSFISVADSRPVKTGRSRSSPARRWAAAPSSTS